MVSITVDHKQQVSIRAGAAFFQITAMDSEDIPSCRTSTARAA